MTIEDTATEDTAIEDTAIEDPDIEESSSNPDGGSQSRSGHRYVVPDFMTRRVLNPVVGALVKVGISPWGASILEVRGRTSGVWRAVPVNIVTVAGERHLVAPRGHTQWVRNLRAAGGEARLRQGRRWHPIQAVELADGEKAPVLRAYLDRFGWEVGRFVEGLTASSTEQQLAGAAPGFPVFRIHEVASL